MSSPSVLSPKLPREGGEKGKLDGKSSGSANAAIDWEDDGVWAAIATSLSVSLPLGLQPGKGTIFDVSSLFDDAWDKIPELNLSSASDFDGSDKESLPGSRKSPIARRRACLTQIQSAPSFLTLSPCWTATMSGTMRMKVLRRKMKMLHAQLTCQCSEFFNLCWTLWFWL